MSTRSSLLGAHRKVDYRLKCACKSAHTADCVCCAGDRGARQFLQEHGVSGVNAQRLVQKYGTNTEDMVRQDPYSCLTAVSVQSTFR